MTKPKKPNILRVRRIPSGSLERLKKAFDIIKTDDHSQNQKPCEECGQLVSISRKPRGDWPLRCADCRRRARLQTKRDTWHRYKEQYRLKRTKPNPSNRKSMGPVIPKGKPSPMRTPPSQIGVSNSNEPAVVWTPETGHKFT